MQTSKGEHFCTLIWEQGNLSDRRHFSALRHENNARQFSLVDKMRAKRFIALKKEEEVLFKAWVILQVTGTPPLEGTSMGHFSVPPHASVRVVLSSGKATQICENPFLTSDGMSQCCTPLSSRAYNEFSSLLLPEPQKAH